jgi:hypothetical protein
MSSSANANVNVKMMSGDVLSFAIKDSYTFRNLRGDFYNLMSKEVEYIECITFFDNGEIVELDDIVDTEKMYNVFITLPYITLRCEHRNGKDKIVFEHIYRQLPRKAIVNVAIPEDRLGDAYRLMYKELDESYDERIDFQQQEFGPILNEDDVSLTFVEYIREYYNRNLTFEELLKEYIKEFVCIRLEIRDITYE